MATPVGTGYLAGHVMRFNKKSQDQHGDPAPSGKGNALKSGNPADMVWGVVFRLRADRLPLLDEAEGLGRGYERQLLQIQIDDSSVPALVYVATADYLDDALLPYDWYRRLVVDGGRAWLIPESYVEAIEAVPTRPDPVRGRAKREWAWRCGNRPMTG